MRPPGRTRVSERIDGHAANWITFDASDEDMERSLAAILDARRIAGNSPSIPRC